MVIKTQTGVFLTTHIYIHNIMIHYVDGHKCITLAHILRTAGNNERGVSLGGGYLLVGMVNMDSC